MHAVAIFVGSVIDDIEFAICKKKKLAEVDHSHAYEANVQTVLV